MTWCPICKDLPGGSLWGFCWPTVSSEWCHWSCRLVFCGCWKGQKSSLAWTDLNAMQFVYPWFVFFSLTQFPYLFLFCGMVWLYKLPHGFQVNRYVNIYFKTPTDIPSRLSMICLWSSLDSEHLCYEHWLYKQPVRQWLHSCGFSVASFSLLYPGIQSENPAVLVWWHHLLAS